MFYKRHKTNSQMGQLIKRFTFMGCEIRKKFDGTRNSKKKICVFSDVFWTDQKEKLIYKYKNADANKYCSRVLGTITFTFFLS
jgi:hypothetical protein